MPKCIDELNASKERSRSYPKTIKQKKRLTNNGRKKRQAFRMVKLQTQFFVQLKNARFQNG